MGLKKYIYKGKLYQSRNKETLLRRLNLDNDYQKVLVKVPWNYKPKK